MFVKTKVILSMNKKNTFRKHSKSQKEEKGRIKLSAIIKNNR